MSNRSTQPALNTSPGRYHYNKNKSCRYILITLFIRSSRETNESNNENPNTISSQNQILLSHWLQRQISSQRIDLSEQFSRLPSDIAVDIDEVADAEETHNESIRYEATQPPVNNQTNPFATVNGILEQNPEVYSVLQSFLRYLPFAILILIKEIYEHTTGIDSNNQLIVTLPSPFSFLFRHICDIGFVCYFHPCKQHSETSGVKARQTRIRTISCYSIKYHNLYVICLLPKRQQ